jgi:hypothetical protein
LPLNLTCGQVRRYRDALEGGLAIIHRAYFFFFFATFFFAAFFLAFFFAAIVNHLLSQRKIMSALRT